MANYSLAAELRTERGKSAARRLRAANIIPAIVYGQQEAVALQIGQRELDKALVSGANLIDLQVDGQKKTVVVKEVQNHPVKGSPIHIDFLEVRMDRPIDTTTTLRIIGESERESDGGLVNVVLRELSISALPLSIPDRIDVDVSSLGIGDSIHVSDLDVAEDVTVLSSPDELIVSIALPAAEEEEADEEDVDVLEPAVVGDEDDDDEETTGEDA